MFSRDHHTLIVIYLKYTNNVTISAERKLIEIAQPISIFLISL